MHISKCVPKGQFKNIYLRYFSLTTLNSKKVNSWKFLLLQTLCQQTISIFSSENQKRFEADKFELHFISGDTIMK